MTEVAVLIAERGARWSDWARAWCGPSRELVLLIQHAQESASEFCARVEHGLDRMRKRTATSQQVVLVAGEQSDVATCVARKQLSRTILEKLGKAARSAQLVIDGQSEQAVALRQQKSVAAALSEARQSAAGRAALASGKLIMPLSSVMQGELAFLPTTFVPQPRHARVRRASGSFARALVKTREGILREAAAREGAHELTLSLSTDGARRLH